MIQQYPDRTVATDEEIKRWARERGEMSVRRFDASVSFWSGFFFLLIICCLVPYLDFGSRIERAENEYEIGLRDQKITCMTRDLKIVQSFIETVVLGK